MQNIYVNRSLAQACTRSNDTDMLALASMDQLPTAAQYTLYKTQATSGNKYQADFGSCR